MNMQEQLDLLSQHERSRSGSQPKGLSGYTLKDILGRAKTNQDGRVTPQASSSEGMMHDEQASFSDAESKVRHSSYYMPPPYLCTKFLMQC